MSDRMRLLFTASPAYGHLLPLLPMLRAATTAGHDVRLATGPDMVGPMRARSVPAYGVGATWDEIVAERDEEAARAHAEDLDAQRVVSASVLFGRAAARRLPGLLDMAGRWRPDVVVHEPLELGGVMLARHLGLPSVTHGYGPMFREYGALGPIVAGATGDPGVWDEMLAGTALDICPPALRPPGAALWPESLDLQALRWGGRRERGLRPGPGPRAAPSARLRHPRHHLQRDPRPDGRHGGGAAQPVGRPGGHHRAGRRPRLAGSAAGARDGPAVRPAGPGAAARRPDGVARGSRHHARRPLPRGAAALPAPRRRPALERRGGRAGPGRGSWCQRRSAPPRPSGPAW